MHLYDKLETNASVPEELVYWGWKEIYKVTGWNSKTPVINSIKKDDFPQPYKMGGKNNMWKKVEVLRWLSTRKRAHIGENKEAAIESN